MKMDKSIKKFDDTKIPKQKFQQYKRPISIKNVDIDKIVIRSLLVKRDLHYLLAAKILKKLDLYVYFS